MALVTLALAKVHLNIPSNVTTEDDELEDFLAVSSDVVEGRADRKFASTTGSQVFNGGTSVFVLNTSPLASVVSVTVSGVALAATAYVADLANGIVRTYSPATSGWSNVTVVYTAGSATIPDIVQHATKEVLRHLWETQRGTGRGRAPRSADGYMPGSGFSFPRAVEELLESVRNIS